MRRLRTTCRRGEVTHARHPAGSETSESAGSRSGEFGMAYGRRNRIVTPAMAKRRRSTPRPPSKNSPKLVALGVGALWRVHPASYRATEFNPSETGDARFSPIQRRDGTTIPVLYGASTLAGAIMETVFHDVPTPPVGYILDIDRLRDQNLVVSRVRSRGTSWMRIRPSSATVAIDSFYPLHRARPNAAAPGR